MSEVLNAPARPAQIEGLATIDINTAIEADRVAREKGLYLISNGKCVVASSIVPPGWVRVAVRFRPNLQAPEEPAPDRAESQAAQTASAPDDEACQAQATPEPPAIPPDRLRAAEEKRRRKQAKRLKVVA